MSLRIIAAAMTGNNVRVFMKGIMGERSHDKRVAMI